MMTDLNLSGANTTEVFGIKRSMTYSTKLPLGVDLWRKPLTSGQTRLMSPTMKLTQNAILRLLCESPRKTKRSWSRRLFHPLLSETGEFPDISKTTP